MTEAKNVKEQFFATKICKILAIARLSLFNASPSERRPIEFTHFIQLLDNKTKLTLCFASCCLLETKHASACNGTFIA